MTLPDNNVSGSGSGSRGYRRPRAGLSGSFVAWVAVAVGVCVVWTVAVVIWLSPSRLATTQASSRAESVLTTMATLSGAAIVLALTAILVGLQLSSRFGSRASRTVTTRPVAAFMGMAGLLGVALPLWAAAEPWYWLRTTGLASFAWTILALGVAGSRVLAHLNPRWLAVHQVKRLYRFLTPEIGARHAQLREAQSVLLEIADGSPEGDVDGHAARRAIAYVGLAGYRLTGNGEQLSELVETLGARARSASHRGESPSALAEVLSLVGVVSDDSDVGISVLRQQSDLAQDAIAQRREPVVRVLLDEVAAFATDRLQALLEPATIAWLAEQNPITSTIGLRVVVPDPEAPADVGHLTPGPFRADRRTVVAWVEDTTPPARRDAEILAGILPPAKDHVPAVRTEAEVIEVGPTLVEPDALGIGVEADPEDSSEAEEPIVIADLGVYLGDAPTPTIAKSDTPKEDQRSEAEWQATLASRRRGSDAYDLIEAVVETLAAACAAPNPDARGWPGGWRGSGAFAADVARLAAPSRALYASGRFPPTDRAEAAIEDFVSRLVRADGPDAQSHEPADPIGWRVPEATLRPEAAKEATTALRELAIEAWRAGFARRALLTIRRLVAVFAVAAARGDAVRAEELAEDLRLAVIRTAQWSDDTIAERWRSRQLVLALAAELSTLGRMVAQLHDDATWETVFGVLDTIGWSPRGSASEAAAEVYLHFFAGSAAVPDEPYFGRPWAVASWGWHPTTPAMEIPDHLRRQLFRELKMSGTLEEPRLAILAILALWRDAFIAGTPERVKALRSALQERILDHGRRSFEPDELWDPAELGKEQPPRFDRPLVHWRVYDVAAAASRWTAESESDRVAAKPALPAVLTPDGDLLEMIKRLGARALVDERDYWGVEYDEDELVLVQEVDGSRRLLRDGECRARSRINWGYGGSGPYDLASLLVADALGPLAYCPSCFGAIGAAAGFVQCPVCEDGMRPGLWELQRACNWLTSRLAQAPGILRVTENTPPGAQWHIRRTDLLDFLVRKIAEFSADDDLEDAPDGSGGKVTDR